MERRNCSTCRFYREGGYCFKVGHEVNCLWVKDCWMNRIYNEQNHTNMETKVCKRCGRELTIDKFAMYKGKVTDLCKECKSESMKMNAMKARAAKAEKASAQKTETPEVTEEPKKVIKKADEPKSENKLPAWKAVKHIVKIADEFIETYSKKELLEMGEEGYYNKVLRQFQVLKHQGLLD